jgi:hypothetical protein
VETVVTNPRARTGGKRMRRMTLEAAGVQFIPENGGGPGVRLRKEVLNPNKAAPVASADFNRPALDKWWV